jgi:hypothetical protein
MRKDRPTNLDANTGWLTFAVSADLRSRINSHIVELTYKRKMPTSRSEITRRAIETYLEKEKLKEKG